MLEITLTPIDKLKAHARNARTHSRRQIQRLKRVIEYVGFSVPLIIDETHTILAGHGRVEAARQLGLKELPTVLLNGLSEAQKRAFLIADNKIAARAGWDPEKLADEFSELAQLLEIEGIDLEITGFDQAEIDQLMVEFAEESDPDDRFEEPNGAAISRHGDLWQLDQHRLYCGNARIENDVDVLMDGKKAAMAFLDPPYNIAVNSIVGRGSIKHREFFEARGEMKEQDFTEFLKATLGNAARCSSPSSLHYICMDWRNSGLLWATAKAVYGRHINTAIWVKTNAGQGSFYRSAHEQVLIYQNGTGEHPNNVELGKHGRSRTNVWTYPGVNTFRKGRMEDLRVHPTVKPVALVSDAMRDCTKRREIVIDLFAGSGTTILAAERVGRRAYCMDIDSLYVDTAIRRWQELTGKDAILAGTSSTFAEIDAMQRADFSNCETREVRR